jgi:hypothetical protein
MAKSKGLQESMMRHRFQVFAAQTDNLADYVEAESPEKEMEVEE